MVLQTTGVIAFGDIRDEFGGSNPMRMAHYNYTTIQTNFTNNIPVDGLPAASNLISASNFYGKSMPMYPPTTLPTAYTTTLSNLTYGNGVYNISATVERNGAGTAARAFNLDGTFWQINPYTNPTSTFSGSNYVGDYVQIQIPQTIRVIRYSIRTLGINNPLEWALGGSTNGTTWTLLHYINNASVTNFTTYEYAVVNPGLYSYFRFVYIRSNGTYPTLAGLKIY